ncbi:MAG: PQQ-like beta-propeller repeat protein [Bryobacteraceae bacterium]|nr:PQQ-like beta-propeller repeat protein [Bryobacteraceae bacterium]
MSRSSYSRAITFLASVAIPPLGMALVWARSRMGVFKKALATLALAGLTVVYLAAFFGLRMERDGTGIWPMFYFGTRESHDRTLAESRERQQRLVAEPIPESTQAALEVKAPTDAPAPAAMKAEPEPAGRTTSAPAPYWTDFRGPNRDGHYREMEILTKWPEKGLQELWRQPVGGGYASFAIAGGRAFTIEQRRDQEVVAAYDMETGHEIWTNSWKASFEESMGGPGPRATPTWHDGRVYAQGAEGELRCIDAAAGKTIWSKNILRDNGASNLQWGMAASPLVVDDKVITLPGGGNGKSVVAYDRLTGEPVWKALDDQQSYTSPMVATLAGRRQLLVVSAGRAMGLTAEEGKLLWEYPWRTSYHINAAQPLVVSGNRFYISAGYGHGAAVVEIAPEGDGFSARTVWENTRMKNKFNGAVLHDGHVYGLDESILACVDAGSGEQKWKGGRYGYGQLLLASGHLIVITETGELALARATPERHEELARFSAIQGKTWNNPAIAGGKLLVRNAREMACYRIAP